jgi:NAD-dependent SIR2 family protein deacetylase
MTAEAIASSVVEKAARLLHQAEFILVCAGAGLSADAGVDFGESKNFLKRYPYLREIGVYSAAHSIGFQWPTKSMEWAFYARHVEEVLLTPPANPNPYLQLDGITRHANRWVLTSNADDLFTRMGFDAERIWTRQGTYAHVQCLRPCSDQVWETKPIVERLLSQVDDRTGELADPAARPICPRCGGEMMLNVRGGSWFVEAPYHSQEERFQSWLRGIGSKRLVVIDVGSGFNTPTVVRWAAEAIVSRLPNAHLIRINLHHPDCYLPLDGRYISIQARGADAIGMLAATIKFLS